MTAHLCIIYNFEELWLGRERWDLRGTVLPDAYLSVQFITFALRLCQSILAVLQLLGELVCSLVCLVLLISQPRNASKTNPVKKSRINMKRFPPESLENTRTWPSYPWRTPYQSLLPPCWAVRRFSFNPIEKQTRETESWHWDVPWWATEQQLYRQQGQS